MATTQLSAIALPGKPHSFLAKDPAPEGGPHTGTFTELSAQATPGQIHSFSAKDEASAPSGPHTGLFTALSALALPGSIHSFSAKAETIAPVIPAPTPTARDFGAGGGIGPDWREQRYERLKDEDNLRRKNILRDDDELMELAGFIVASGILD
jgi:hypothetical protein